MNRFGALVQQISFMEDPLDQQRVLVHYLSQTPEPDRSAAIAFLHNPPRRGRIQLKKLREIVENKVGPELFALSHRFVGDMAETMALLWQPGSVPNRPVSPSGFAERLATTGPLGLTSMIEGVLDSCDPSGRLAAIRILTAGFRRPVAPEVLHAALEACGLPVPEVHSVHIHEAAQQDLFTGTAQDDNTPGVTEAVLMYVEGARGKQAALLCTFGVWAGDAIVPVARIEAGSFRDQIATFAKEHTLRRFGPSSEVEHSVTAALVGTLEFDGIEASRRHKAGVSLKSPRLVAVHPGITAADAANIEELTSRLPTSHTRG
jgi:hypothetical protein